MSCAQTTALFDSAKADLSAKQFDILSRVTFLPGLTAVVAAAGAGKTLLLSYLVGRALLYENISQVFLLSTTRTAKEEAKERCINLQRKLGGNMATKILKSKNVKTIHSCALSWAKFAHEDSEVQIVSKSEVLDLIRSLLKTELMELEATEADRTRKPIKGDVLKNMDIGKGAELLYEIRAERLKACRPVADRSLGPTAQKVFEILAVKMQGGDEKKGPLKIDFDLMINDMAMSGSGICGKGDVLFIDETQDLSLCQVSIVINTLKAGACVFVLGDESQGIFGFSGAMPNTFKTLQKHAKNEGCSYQKFELFQNHRSNNGIVSVSESFLPEEDRKTRSGITGNGSHNFPVMITKSSDEPKAVARAIIELVKQNVARPEQIVVLRHKNFQTHDPFVVALDNEAKKFQIDCKSHVTGIDPSNSISAKTASILRMVLGLENFIDDVEEATYLVKNFLKSLRGVSADLTLTGKAIDDVWNEQKCMPGELFSRHVELLKVAFLERLEELDRKQVNKYQAESARKRPKKTGLESIKYKNFCAAVEVAATTLAALALKFEEAFENRLVVNLNSVARSTSHLSVEMKKPNVSTNLGAFVLMIVSELVDFKPTGLEGESGEIQSIVTRFDNDNDGGFDSIHDMQEFAISQTAKLINDTINVHIGDKVLFSTIHRFKGRERSIAFSVNVKAPYYEPTWAKRASLVNEHDEECGNKSGEFLCRCAGYASALQAVTRAGLNEKLRLYYVAASRAKERLFLSSSQGDRQLSTFETLVSPAKMKETELGWQECKHL